MPTALMADLGLAERPLLRAKPVLPRRWRTVILNDEYTPAEFVVELLRTVFRLGHEQAVSVTLETHRRGVGVCGLFPRDVAETKAMEAMAMARSAGHPLKSSSEPAD